MNHYGSGLSTEMELDVAIKRCTREAMTGLDNGAPELVLFFVSHEHHAGFGRLAEQIQTETGARHVVGCAGETVVGLGREIEGGPALSLWLARLPAAKVTAFRLEPPAPEHSKDLDAYQGMPELPSDPAEIAERKLSILLFGEPFSFPANDWVEQLNERHPGLQVLGGMASGGNGPGTNRLFEESGVVREGAVGVLLEGVAIHHVVSQGCRPIGKSMIITRSRENVILELAGKPPLRQLEELYNGSEAEEKQLLHKALTSGGLHVGQVVDERISKPERGDFLIRNVIDSDQKSGAIAIGDYARRGRTVCFHIRDDVSADEDLRCLLENAGGAVDPGGALIFSCNGRGTRMFQAADHDAACIQEQFTRVPLAGFFAAGEIGPVGGRNFLHGFTASIALFER